MATCRIPEVLTRGECVRLVKQPTVRYLTGLRDRCMMDLMLNTGLRSAECLSLKVRDIDWTTHQLRVRQGKGKKDRILWVNPSTLQLIDKWLIRRREERGIDSPLLFTTLAGDPINSRALRAMVKRRGLKAGITKDCHPHMLRHTFATELLRADKNLATVQKTLGHSRVTTTAIYTHLVDDDVEQALRHFNITGGTVQ